MNPLLPPINTSHQLNQNSQHISQPSIYDENSSRHRQAYTLPITPGLQRNDYNQSEMKDTQIVSPNHENNQYHPNGGTQTNHRNSYSYSTPTKDKDTTLSTFLHTLFLSAKSSINNTRSNSNRTLSNNNNSFNTELTPSAKFSLPSTTTISFISLCSLWYLSSALSSNTGKVILTQFRYPVTLTIVQFMFVAGYSVVFLAAKERLSHFRADGGSASWSGRSRRPSMGASESGIPSFSFSSWGIKKPTKMMFQSTLIMSLFQIAGHIFSSMAIQRVPVSTVHTIKALSPLFTVLSYAVLFRVRYGPSTYTALAPLTLGVMLACSFDLQSNAVGLICALGSTIVFVSQNIFLKKLLPKESKEPGILTSNSNNSNNSGSLKLDKLNLLFYSSGTAFVLTIPIWLYSDFSSILASPLSSIPISTTSSTTPPSLFVYFFLNGTTNFAQNLIAFSILSRTSPVTYSIASLVKRIAVICMAIIWSKQTVSLIQGLGMGMTFIGLWMYNRAKVDVEKGERKRVLVEKKLDGGFLPSTMGEARELDGSGASTPVPLIQQRYHERRSTMGVNSLSSNSEVGSNNVGLQEESKGDFNIPFPTPPTSPIRR